MGDNANLARRDTALFLDQGATMDATSLQLIAQLLPAFVLPNRAERNRAAAQSSNVGGHIARAARIKCRAWMAVHPDDGNGGFGRNARGLPAQERVQHKVAQNAYCLVTEFAQDPGQSSLNFFHTA